MIEIEIEHGSTNVYEDLGLPNAAEMHIKAILAEKIGEIKMLECMNKLGRDVEIVVRKSYRSRAAGKTSVPFA